jgi:FemAB-related protein (PEP-CTERM system-associated)
VSITVKTIQPTEEYEWDNYVLSNADANLYHMAGWKNVIEKAYGHRTYYLMAERSISDPTESNLTKKQKRSVVGILSLVHLKHYIFGNNLISIPFFDMSGILADDEEVEKTLIYEAMKLGKKLRVESIELRHTRPLTRIDSNNFHDLFHNPKIKNQYCCFKTLSHKVRMLLSLPESSEELMKSFKSKLRSQIKKSVKDGLTAKIGGLEYLDEFYDIFSVNMRDLGSPVHSKKLILNVLEQFPENSKIVIVSKENTPIACSMTVGFKDTLENPWASSLREYSRSSPNMLLYWTMLAYACDNGYKYFDFGRSTPAEGTYKFKAQWGAKPHKLYWHYISLNSQPIDNETTKKSKFDKAIQYWQKIPVPVTKIIGPMIRKHIGL